MLVAVRSWKRSALLAAALVAAPSLASAQGQSGAAARVDSIVVTAPSVRVRSAPSPQSLSIDEFAQGSVFPLASEEYHSKEWLGIVLDGRVAFIPRYAVVLKPQGVARAPATEPVGAGRPITPPAATPFPAPTPNSAPAVVASHPASAEPGRAPTSEPKPAPTSVTTVATAAPAPAPAPVPPPALTPAARPVAPTAAPPRPRPLPSIHGPETAASRPIDFTLGLLASVTPIRTAGLPTMAHVAGLSFVGAQYRGWGAYLAPELGSGGQYRSTLLGGGLSRDLVWMHMLRVTALVGYASYTETPNAAARSIRGPSFGGMVSIPLLGPMRLAYRGQYVKGPSQSDVTRYSVGLIF